MSKVKKCENYLRHGGREGGYSFRGGEESADGSRHSLIPSHSGGDEYIHEEAFGLPIAQGDRQRFAFLGDCYHAIV